MRHVRPARPRAFPVRNSARMHPEARARREGVIPRATTSSEDARRAGSERAGPVRTRRARVADEPLIADGGAGTTLVGRGIATPHSPFELLNRERAADVAAVHSAFADAGARLVETNTFGANRFALARHGLEGRVSEINTIAVELATRAGVLIAGSAGP